MSQSNERINQKIMKNKTGVLLQLLEKFGNSDGRFKLSFVNGGVNQMPNPINQENLAVWIFLVSFLLVRCQAE